MANTIIRIVIIAGGEGAARHVIDVLNTAIHVEKVIIDPGLKRSKILFKRIKRVGLLAFIGQLMFRFIVIPILHRLSKEKKSELYASYIKNRPFEPLPFLEYIENINSDEGNQLLKSINPDAIVVVSRRIISKQTLERIKVKFINIHDGIVPKYRGLFGAYWAMVENDIGNCGATVHFIDQNLDTGAIITQTNIVNYFFKDDNFVTYPLHQFASALPKLNRALLDLGHGRLTTVESLLKVGKIWFIPTISHTKRDIK